METNSRFSVEFRIGADNKSVRFYNPSVDDIPLPLFSAILLALERVENEYNGQ